MIKIEFSVTDDTESGGFIATADGIVTQAETLNGLFLAIKDAVECHENEAIIVMGCALRVAFCGQGQMSPMHCTAEYIYA